MWKAQGVGGELGNMWWSSVRKKQRETRPLDKSFSNPELSTWKRQSSLGNDW